MILFASNTGARDLWLDGQPLARPRPQGEQILADFKAHADRICAPILGVGIEDALKEVERLDRVVLFATDQPESEPEKFRERDTLHIARALARWLRECSDAAARIGDVEVVRVQGAPQDYEAMFSFYRQFFRADNPVPDSDVDRAFLLCSSGTPASNTALLLAATLRYRDRAQAVYVTDTGTDRGKVLRSAFSAQILGTYRSETASALLAEYDFAAAARLVPEPLAALCRYAHHRLLFNFAEAAGELQKVKDVGQHGEFFSTLVDEARQLEGAKEVMLQCRELCFNLQVQWERQAYVDFLGRIFRLEEALLGYALQQVGFSRAAVADIERMGTVAAERKDLAVHLSKRRMLRNGVLRMGASRPGRRKILKDYCSASKRNMPQGVDVGCLRRVRDISDALGKLSKLRNRSILAHGFRGVSAEDLKARGVGKNARLFRDLREFFEFQEEDNVFSKIARYVTENLVC